MNNNYDWSETNSSLTLIFPIPYKLDKKKIDYMITELYVKINMLELKRIHIIDLLEPIEFTQGEMVLEDTRIMFILPKKESKIWKTVEFKGTKAELKDRRKLADDKYYEKIKADRELAEKKKNEFQQFAIDRSIKVDDARRDEIRNKKSIEKNKAVDDLYHFVDKYDKGHYKPIEGGDEDDIPPFVENKALLHQQLNDIKEEEEEEIDTSSHKQTKPQEISLQEQKPNEDHNDTPAVEKEKKEEPEIIKINSPMVQMENSFQKAYNTINNPPPKPKPKETEFKKEPPKQNNPKTQTKIREQQKFEVNLTEQKIPHFAARESLSKEPPYPKSKKLNVEKNYLGQEIDDRNPVWIKERADNFYKNKDYVSAINAYNKALDLDPNFHKCLMNRGTCYLSVGDFDAALNDFNKVLDFIANLDEKEKQDTFYDKIRLRTLVKKYAVFSLKQEYQTALRIIDDEILIKNNNFPFLIPSEIWKKVEYDRKMIQNRMDNEIKKVQGDAFLSKKDYENAKKIYLDILEKEPNNERVLSNLSLIYLNEQNYDETIKCCTQILSVFNKFKEKIKFKNMNNSFEIKVLLRRAKCYEIKNEMHLAEKDINSIEKLSIKNEQVLKEIKSIKDKLKVRVVESYKESANQLLSKGQFSDALSYYDKAISLIKFSNIYNKIDLVKIILNRIGCLIKLTQYDSTFLEFEKIFMILSKQKAIADIQSNLVLKTEVNKLEFLSYVKRAYVYSINKNYKDAINDYNEALKINPSDSKIKENLEKIKLLI